MNGNKIIIVGGCGHIGLPLAIMLSNVGYKVVAYDKNESVVKKVLSGNMPYYEEDGNSELQKAFKSNNLEVRSKLIEEDIGSDFILSIGTPVDEFLNPKFSEFEKTINEILNYLNEKSLVIIRSTVFPGTTEWLHDFLHKHNKKTKVSFCLERSVQSKTFTEMSELPQIVSGTSEEATKRSCDIFKKISKKIITCQPKEAELAKLFTNTFRYMQFAISNEFYKISDRSNLNFHKIYKIMSDDYPRMNGLPKPGFAAGPCLFKDTLQLVSYSNNSLSLGINSMQVNEGMVFYIKEVLEKKYDLKNTTVGLLGMSFKKDSDDIRASLSYKLKKILNISCKSVLCSDDHVKNDFDLISLNEIIEKSDVLVLCTPHTYFKNLKTKKPIIDIWNHIN